MEAGEDPFPELLEAGTSHEEVFSIFNRRVEGADVGVEAAMTVQALPRYGSPEA